MAMLIEEGDAHGPHGRALHPEARGLRGEEARLHVESVREDRREQLRAG